MKAIISLIQALLFLVSSFAQPDSSFKLKTDRAALDVSSKTYFSFESIQADETSVTESEKRLCRNWFEENILFAGQNGKSPAYDFTVGGKKLKNHLDDWVFLVKKDAEISENSKKSFIYLTHKKSGLTARIEAVLYEEYASCEWTVYIMNSGKENSPVIKNFYAADFTLDTGRSTLYVSKGSRPAADDFELMESMISFFPMHFTANGGRSESFLPYFNICGRKFGIVTATGWTGQWHTSCQETLSGIHIKANQESFKAYLEPDEQVRSPLTSVTFYENKNPVKGFNSFRKFQTECICPEGAKTMNGFVIANEFSTLTTDELIDKIDNLNPDVLDSTDYFWMDAGWYEYNESWADGVGNWTADPKRFPDGLKKLGDAIKEKGKRFLLWYEPERVRENTFLYNEAMKHDTWIIEEGDNLLFNLGDKDARSFLSEYIAKSLNDNGVSIYRQDFNFSPLTYWQKADKNFYGNRTGISENHYVSGLYEYLDFLLDNVDSLLIDNCASGGKRLDIEMARRSIPLWRSDYNCGNADGTIKDDVLEATQAMTYSLSFWIPYSGTNRYFHSEYASRSAILTEQSVYEPDPYEYTAYGKISDYMSKAYYPLEFGGTDNKKYLAMQYGEYDGSEGAAVIYKREDVRNDTFVLKLSGLEPDREYEISDFDGLNKTVTLSGKALMKNGVEICVKETPKAAIIFYKAK